MPTKFLVLGGGVGVFWRGGGSANCISMGVGISESRKCNTVSRVLFRKRELTEYCGKLGEFCEKLGDFALAHQ